MTRFDDELDGAPLDHEDEELDLDEGESLQGGIPPVGSLDALTGIEDEDDDIDFDDDDKDDDDEDDDDLDDDDEDDDDEDDFDDLDDAGLDDIEDPDDIELGYRHFQPDE